MMQSNICHHGDALAILRTLPDACVQMCVTSPPYWGLRDYGVPGQLGLEATPDEFVARMVEVFAEVRRVLADDGTCWVNLGDSYASKPAGANGFNDGRANRDERSSGGVPPGLKPKDLVGIPWRVAFALQADGWYLRQDIIWHKPNPMPESVTDRCTKAHEYIFLLSKSPRYYYDAEAIAEQSLTGDTRIPYAPGQVDARGSGHDRNGGDQRNSGGANRNRRSVWTVPSAPYPDAHFATYPPGLIEPCILAGSRPGDVVLDPFMGSGTTAEVAQNLGRQWVGIEINAEYIALQHRRTAQGSLALEIVDDIDLGDMDGDHRSALESVYGPEE